MTFRFLCHFGSHVLFSDIDQVCPVFLCVQTILLHEPQLGHHPEAGQWQRGVEELRCCPIRQQAWWVVMMMKQSCCCQCWRFWIGTQMLMCAIACGGYMSTLVKDDLHWKLTLGEKSCAALGSQSCFSNAPDLLLNQMSYIPSLKGHVHTKKKNLTKNSSLKRGVFSHQSGLSWVSLYVLCEAVRLNPWSWHVHAWMGGGIAYVFMYMEENNCAHKILPFSGWTFKLWQGNKSKYDTCW